MHGTKLIEHLYEVTESGLGTNAHAAGRRVLLDTVGCALFGSKQPWVRMIAETVWQNTGPSTVLGYSRPLHPAAAALVNGTAAHGFELDDYIEGCFAHAGATVVTAALATAEAIGADGRRLLCAIVAGYELMGRSGLALGISRSDGGLHYTGQVGPSGAALAAGIVRGFDVLQLRNTVGIAASMGGGVKAFTQGSGGMVKRLHAGRAAEAGVLAAELTERGFTGPLDALDGRFGLIPSLGGADADAAALSNDLDGPFLISRNWTKLYPCCAVLHSACQAVEELRSEHHLLPEGIRQIRVGGSERMATQNSGRTFKDTMAAQYSMPFAAAVALVDDAGDPKAFEPGRVDDPAFRHVMDLVRVEIDPEIDRAYPEAFGARVEIELTDGRRLERMIMHPKGSGTAGVSDTEIEAKFRSLAAGFLRPDSVDAVIAGVFGVEAPGGVAALSRAITMKSPVAAE